MKKVLIIEDNEDVRENVADMLELANYQVFTAENGEMGLIRAKQFKPDLIVCDIMMPGMDGYEVLHALGEEHSTATIPFIFLTAKTDKADVRTGMNLGADDYLTKPFEEKELLDAVSCRLKKSEFLQKEISKSLDGLTAFMKEASEYTDLESLSKDHQLKLYKKKEWIFSEGDYAHSLYFVERGSVKTYKSTESGKELITGFYGPGDFIGQLSMLNEKGLYIENAMVLEDAEVCPIPKEDFTKLLYGNPVVSRKFISLISNNLIDVQQKLVAMAFAPVRQRLAQTLLELYEKGVVKQKPNEGMSISREDLAGMIGTATETAVRMLTDLKDEGLLTTDRARRVVLLKIDELRRIAILG
jgi:CRP-like cAMP-binding protein